MIDSEDFAALKTANRKNKDKLYSLKWCDWVFCFSAGFLVFFSFSKCGALNETCIFSEAPCISCIYCKLFLDLLSVTLLLPLLNPCWF